ncbi:hypothetical protein [Croceiramulus getboli]|nr:hypothetical protein P8624_03530 [Flavobacteriaceae bacterium YJPT1-3]
MYKILKIVALILALLGAVWLVRIILAGDDAIKGSADLQASLITPFMYFAFATLAIVVVFVVFFIFKGLFSNPQTLKNTLVAVSAFATVVFLCWLVSTGVETPMKDGEVLSASGSRWVETGIRSFYAFALLAIGAMVWSGIRKFRA